MDNHYLPADTKGNDMIAIHCKYLGPTNCRGARIKASAHAKASITIGYPHELSGAAVFAEAAIALCRKMRWKGKLISGGLDDGSYVFCFAESESFEVGE